MENNLQPKTIRDLDVFDTVWIEDNTGIISEGWVYDITRRHVIVTIPDKNFQDYRFMTNRRNTQQTITQNNITLYCNKPCK